MLFLISGSLTRLCLLLWESVVVDLTSLQLSDLLLQTFDLSFGGPDALVLLFDPLLHLVHLFPQLSS